MYNSVPIDRNLLEHYCMHLCLSQNIAAILGILHEKSIAVPDTLVKLVANPCCARDVWGHRDLMVMDKVYMEPSPPQGSTVFTDPLCLHRSFPS